MTERMIVDEISNIIRQHSGEAACRLAERIIAAIQAHLAAAGYAVVPKEATPEMAKEMDSILWIWSDHPAAKRAGAAHNALVQTGAVKLESL